MTLMEIVASAWMTQQKAGELFVQDGEFDFTQAEGCGLCDEFGRDLIIAKTAGAAALLEEHGHLYESGHARAADLSASHSWKG